MSANIKEAIRIMNNNSEYGILNSMVEERSIRRREFLNRAMDESIRRREFLNRAREVSDEKVSYTKNPYGDVLMMKPLADKVCKESLADVLGRGQSISQMYFDETVLGFRLIRDNKRIRRSVHISSSIYTRYINSLSESSRRKYMDKYKQ